MQMESAEVERRQIAGRTDGLECGEWESEGDDMG